MTETAIPVAVFSVFRIVAEIERESRVAQSMGPEKLLGPDDAFCAVR